MRIKLSSKGRRMPPPVLDVPLQRLSEEVQSWPGIIAATQWHLSLNGQADGIDFYWGDEELGNLHLDGELHLATRLAQALVGAGLAQPFPFAGVGEWLLYSIRSEADARHAEWLMRLAYDHLGGTLEPELVGALSLLIPEGAPAAMQKA